MENKENTQLIKDELITEFIKQSNNKATLVAIISHFNIESKDKHLVRRQLKKLVKNKVLFKLGKVYQANNLNFNSSKAIPKNLKVRVLVDSNGNHYCKAIAKKAEKVFKNAKIEIENYSKDYLNKDIVVKISRIEDNKIIVVAPSLVSASLQNNEISEEQNLKAQEILQNAKVEDINNKSIIIGQVTSLEGANKALVKSITFGVRKSFTIQSVPEYVKKGDIVKFANPLNEDGIETKTAHFLQLVHKESELLSLSILSLKELGIPIDFLDETLAELKELTDENITSESENREDLTNIPFVTIDGDDSKDFDDAVYCKPYFDSKHKECYHISVAIADVASYVKKGSALDKEALLRANSVYLPNMVVPMLPPLLSNNLCSLVPNKTRKVVVAHIYINNKGSILKYNFTNALIKSHARLTYNNVQKYITQGILNGFEPEIKSAVDNLYNCFKILNDKNIARGALKINLPETKIIIDESENVTEVKQVYQETSNKIIEEFMVLANVCCALFIKDHGFEKNAVFRIHEKPDFNKVLQLKDTLKYFKYNLDTKRKINGSFFNSIIDDFSSHESKDIIYKSILQTQSQAKYSNDNIGHFGLALEDYCHFTSPIRRYSDLIVHRIIKDILLKKDFIYDKSIKDIASDISAKERRATNAEYNSKDRIVAKWFAESLDKNKIYNAKITSVTKSGIFIKITDLYAKGLVPARFLTHDYFVYDGRRNILKGARTKQQYGLGDNIEVKVAEVDVLRGLIAFYPVVDIKFLKDTKRPAKRGKFNKKPTTKGGKPPARGPARGNGNKPTKHFKGAKKRSR